MKSKKEENEIFPVAPYPSKGWLVYSETEWFSLDHDSSHKDREFSSAFPWKPCDGKGNGEEAAEESWIKIID